MRDLLAGLCVAALVLPEAVAYAGLAQVPVAQALVATLVGLSVYALLGRSRCAVVSPTSSGALLAAAAALSLPASAGNPQVYAQAFLALTLLAGLLLIALALAQQGSLAALVSRPVLRGFAFALAVSIVIRQLPDALGVVLPPSVATDPLRVLWALAAPTTWSLPSLALSGGALAVVLALRRCCPRWPPLLLLLPLALLIAHLWALPVSPIGPLQHLQWHWGLPSLPLADWLRLSELAFGLVLLLFAESWASIRTQALARGDTVSPNRELLVLGLCNVSAGLLHGMPVGAGFSASAANLQAGAKSRWAGACAALAVALVAAWGLPVLQKLPRPVLAVAVMVALAHPLSLAPLIRLWQMRRDRLLLIAAVAAVLLFGVLHGMLAAIALSLVDALRRFSQPLVHELGELGQSRNFVAVAGTPEAHRLPGLLILRPEEPLFFASAERVVTEVLHRAQLRQGDGGDGLHTVVLSLEESADLDSTALECLRELDQRLRQQGIRLVLARVKEPVRELLHRCDPQGLGQPQALHWSVADAVQGLQAGANANANAAPSGEPVARSPGSV